MDPQMEGLLQLMDQPVFLVRDGSVIWNNPAAEQLVTVGQGAESILRAGTELYEQWDRRSVIETDLTLLGETYGVKIRGTEAGDIFILRPLSRELSAGEENHIYTSGKIRQILQELFPACMTLQDYMEFREELMDEAARVNRSLYRLLRLSNKLSREEQLFHQDITPYLERTDLRRFLSEFVEEMGPILEEGGWKLTLVPINGTIHGNIDRELMKQALYYMVSHGVSHSLKGSELLLKTWEQGSGIRFSLTHGVGRNPGNDAVELPDLELVRAIASLHEGALFQFDEGAKGNRMVLSIRKMLPSFPLKERYFRGDVYGEFHPGLVELSDVMEHWMYHPDRV